MKYLTRTLAILAMLTMTIQTARHAYVLWWQPQGSVLDRFDQPVLNQISSAKTLEDLVRAYEPVRKEAERTRASHSEGAPPPEFARDFDLRSTRPEALLRQAIQDWEEKAKEIHALRFYASLGIVLALFGGVLYLKWNRWFGLSVLVTTSR